MNATSMSVRSALIAACASAALSQKERSALMNPTNPITEPRDHYFTLKVFVPSNVTCTEDRLRWYFDHAIRGYYKQFALETDPIRGMLDCSVTVEKTPLKTETQAAEIARLTAQVETQRKELSEYRSSTAYSDLYHEAQGLAAELTALKAKLAKAEEAIRNHFDALDLHEKSNDGFGKSRETYAAVMATLATLRQFTKGEEG